MARQAPGKSDGIIGDHEIWWPLAKPAHRKRCGDGWQTKLQRLDGLQLNACPRPAGERDHSTARKKMCGIRHPAQQADIGRGHDPGRRPARHRDAKARRQMRHDLGQEPAEADEVGLPGPGSDQSDIVQRWCVSRDLCSITGRNQWQYR